MAFYSVRVNDDGIEIERPKSCREYDTRFFQSPSSTSDQESIISRQASSTGGIFTRYINPAICITKTDTSVKSLSDTVPSIIPPLDLNSSGETMPSTDSAPNISYTIQKACVASKISQSDAFSNWLSGKKKLKLYEQSKQKELEKDRKREMEEKKKLAEEKYNEWITIKNQKANNKPTAPQSQNAMERFEEVCQSYDDSESNRRAWEANKLKEQRKKRDQILKERERQKLLEEKRKEQAAKAWENWIAEAPLKPKPVPLNKGFLTLKGTISDIYVNPNPWQDTYEVNECN